MPNLKPILYGTVICYLFGAILSKHFFDWHISVRVIVGCAWFVWMVVLQVENSIKNK